MELSGRVALVTGGSQGIGRAVCEAYLREGGKVVTTARTAKDLSSAVEEMQALGDIAGFPADISKGGDVRRLVEEAVRVSGHIDILVNNAGVVEPMGGPVDVTEEDWDLVMDNNVKGTFLCVRETVSHMPPTGSIINVTSGLARGPSAAFFPYSLSKWTVEGLTRIFARSLRQRVNAVDPGVVATRMTRFNGASPESVTPVFLYLASEKSKDVRGEVLRVEDFRRPSG